MYGAKRLNQIAALFTTTRCQQRLSHSSAASRVGYERKRKKWMPQELTGGVVELTCKSSAPSGVCNVYLVGTHHCSPECAKVAQAAVRFFKPEVVFLELCSYRKFILTGQLAKVPTIREMVDMWRMNMTASYIIFYWHGCKLNLDKTWNGVYGGEFYLANAEAMKYGAKVILGDRPYPVTHMRYMGKASLLDLFFFESTNLPIYHDKKLRGKIHAGTVDRLNEEIAKEDPIWAQTFINERDQYMSAKILEVAAQHESVVAVVGSAHVPGIKNYWNRKHPIDVKQLLSVPKQPITLGSILSSIIAILIIILRIIRASYIRRKLRLNKI